MINDVCIKEGSKIGVDIVYKGSNGIVVYGSVVPNNSKLSVGFLCILLNWPKDYGTPFISWLNDDIL